MHLPGLRSLVPEPSVWVVISVVPSVGPDRRHPRDFCPRQRHLLLSIHVHSEKHTELVAMKSLTEYNERLWMGSRVIAFHMQKPVSLVKFQTTECVRVCDVCANNKNLYITCIFQYVCFDAFDLLSCLLVGRNVWNTFSSFQDMPFRFPTSH